MSIAIRTHIVRIGNSRGVRIPEALLDQLDLGDVVEIFVQGDRLIIRSARQARRGGEERFRAMHDREDDRRVDKFPASDWDAREWDW